MRSRIAIILSAAALLFLAAPSFAKNFVIGFSQCDTAESDWRKANTESFSDAAKKFNITLVFRDAAGNTDVQRNQVQEMIDEKVDAIVLAANDVNGWDDVLLRAKAARIPVVLADRTIQLKPENHDKGLYVAWIGSDFRYEGRVAAAWLAEQTGGHCNIVEITGPPDAAPSIERGRGFREIISLFPGMKVIDSKPGYWREEQSKDVMSEFLKDEGANIGAVFAQNDNMAFGAIDAIEENKDLGLKPGSDILVMGVDGTHHGFQLLMQDKINALIECNPLQGPIVLKVVNEILNGRRVPPVIYMQESVFTQLNAATAFPTRRY